MAFLQNSPIVVRFPRPLGFSAVPAKGAVHADDPTTTNVTCHGCGGAIVLRLRPAVLAESAWRWFECPHCRKPNFLRLAGQILSVAKEQQKV